MEHPRHFRLGVVPGFTKYQIEMTCSLDTGHGCDHWEETFLMLLAGSETPDPVPQPQPHRIPAHRMHGDRDRRGVLAVRQPRKRVPSYLVFGSSHRSVSLSVIAAACAGERQLGAFGAPDQSGFTVCCQVTTRTFQARDRRHVRAFSWGGVDAGYYPASKRTRTSSSVAGALKPASNLSYSETVPFRSRSDRRMSSIASKLSSTPLELVSSSTF